MNSLFSLIKISVAIIASYHISLIINGLIFAKIFRYPMPTGECSGLEECSRSDSQLPLVLYLTTFILLTVLFYRTFNRVLKKRK